MYHKRSFYFAVAVLVGLAYIIYPSSCKREPVYIGSLDGDPIDTTGTGGNNNLHPCSPDSVYFNMQVLPILTSNCAMAGCHDAITQAEGVILNNYANVRNTGGIKLTNPASSELYEVLIDPDPNDRMPPSPAPALTADQRALILKWIQQGALNLTCEADCDTSNVTYAAIVKPVLSLNCQGCHSGSSPSGGIPMTSYAEIKTLVTNGKLVGSIQHKPGFFPMPYPTGSNKLRDCDLRKIQIWIDKGALNN